MLGSRFCVDRLFEDPLQIENKRSIRFGKRFFDGRFIQVEKDLLFAFVIVVNAHSRNAGFANDVGHSDILIFFLFEKGDQSGFYVPFCFKIGLQIVFHNNLYYRLDYVSKSIILMRLKFENNTSYPASSGYDVLGEFQSVNDLLEFVVNGNKTFNEIIVDENTELLSKD